MQGGGACAALVLLPRQIPCWVGALAPPSSSLLETYPYKNAYQQELLDSTLLIP
jgi:hypothetical protein